MTATYDPRDPAYADEASVRSELTRVFDVCHGCQRCVEMCGAFPALFELIDRHGGGDAGRLTPAEQDRVVGECFHCVRCFGNCPYTPAVDVRAIDVPRLMLRAEAMRHANGHLGAPARRTTRLLGRPDRVGRLATSLPGLANRAVAAKPGGAARSVLQRLTGVSSVRLLPPYTRQRFTTWFRRRPTVPIPGQQATVAIFPTCAVEYHEPAIGIALVGVYERNGVECSLAAATRCCGAVYLHGGDVASFRRLAAANVRDLAASIRGGTDVVVPQPTCSYVITHDYVDHLGGADAELVARHTFDACAYLIGLARGPTTRFDTDFTGEVPRSIACHVPCHLAAQGAGEASRDLLGLTGARISVVQQCSGIDGLWGLREDNARISVPMGQRLGEAVRRAGAVQVAGDCHLANTVIAEQTGAAPLHPLQVLARAYGLDAGGPSA